MNNNKGLKKARYLGMDINGGPVEQNGGEMIDREHFEGRLLAERQRLDEIIRRQENGNNSEDIIRARREVEGEISFWERELRLIDEFGPREQVDSEIVGQRNEQHVEEVGSEPEPSRGRPSEQPPAYSSSRYDELVDPNNGQVISTRTDMDEYQRLNEELRNADELPTYGVYPEGDVLVNVEPNQLDEPPRYDDVVGQRDEQRAEDVSYSDEPPTYDEAAGQHEENASYPDEPPRYDDVVEQRDEQYAPLNRVIRSGDLPTRLQSLPDNRNPRQINTSYIEQNNGPDTQREKTLMCGLGKIMKKVLCFKK